MDSFIQINTDDGSAVVDESETRRHTMKLWRRGDIPRRMFVTYPHVSWTLVLLTLVGGFGIAIVLVSKPAAFFGVDSEGNSSSSNIVEGTDTSTSLLQEAGLSLPSEAGAWMIVAGAGGGFNGNVQGGVVITSQGAVAAGGPASPEKFRLSCTAQLSAADLQMIDHLVRSAAPSTWKARYFAPSNPNGCCDQFGHDLEIHRRQVDGNEQNFVTSWYDSGGYLLPKDAAAIYKATLMIKSKVLMGCKS